MERDQPIQAPRLEPINRRNFLANKPNINIAKEYNSLEDKEEVKNLPKEIEDQESELQLFGLLLT